MKYAGIKHIEFFLGEKEISDEMLVKENPTWDLTVISQKVGIKLRHVVNPNQCASDLAILAAEKLFSQVDLNRSDIDFILFCTQSADYFLPATACLIQERLGIKSCGAFDYNIGCSGFVYGLGIAKGLLETNQANNVLLITADTYSRFVHPKDRSARVLFSDAAAVALLTNKADKMSVGPFAYFTSGSGANNLIVREGAMRHPASTESYIEKTDPFGNVRTGMNLYMNGPEIMSFALDSVPRIFNKFFQSNGLSIDEIDFFVFHQANKHILEELRYKLKIHPEKFYVSSCSIGNTVSSSIPIALKKMQLEGLLKSGDKLLLLGFGVGYSIGMTLISWL